MIKTSTSPPARWIELELEVPGTPEQVWRAIATPAGLAAWFTEAEIEPREGGALLLKMGEMGDSPGLVTAWEPPRRFGYRELGWRPDAPPADSEWAITPEDGGGCRLRVINKLVTDSPAWDADLASWEEGWSGFFPVLGLYLAHFADQPAAALSLLGTTTGDKRAVVAGLERELGLGGPRVDHADPPLAGEVVRRAADSLLLRTTAPGPGCAMIGAFEYDGTVYASLRLWVYGDGAQATIARTDPAWRAWWAARFKPLG